MEAVIASAEQPDRETAQRLESLGYVGGGSVAGDGPLRDPKDMMPVLNLITKARALLKAGRLPEALATIQRAASVSPRNRTMLDAMSKIYLTMNREQEAEETLRLYIDIKPGADQCLLLAQILIKQGRLADAVPLLDQAENLDPQHGGVSIAQGDLLTLQGHHAEALAAFERAKLIDPYRVAGMADARINDLRRRMQRNSP